MNTIAIIGGGASGMAAALAARESLNNRVILIERQNRVGRKLLATGNGRCNLTNEYADLSRYHGENVPFIAPAMERFTVENTLAWFQGLGLMTRTEPDSGRVYPLSDAASSVVDTLRLALEARGVELLCGCDIVEAKQDGVGFLLTSALTEEIRCNKLIVACGGMAGAKLGGTKAGYELLGSLGHGRTALHPSLVQLKTDNTYTRSMKGVRTQAKLTLEKTGRLLDFAQGEVQFTDYGVTGPAVYELSRTASFAGDGCVLCLRLLPELDKAQLWEYLDRKRNDFPNYKAESLLSGALHNAIARTILRRAEIPAETRLWSLADKNLAQISELIRRFELPLQGTLTFDEAQVTAGGMDTEQFDPETMESRLVSGLYACGEVLDIDGDCGGFNLQWAWSSGRLAGFAAAGLL